jgi:glucosamine-phosphate N-acetyltransferase
MTILNTITYCDFVDFYHNNTLNISKFDIKNEYLKLLGELTKVDELDDKIFETNLNKINSMGKIIIGYVFSGETNCFEIVGSGTVIIEPKIIRGGKSVAHIEDIVVKFNWRCKKISQNILNELKDYAKLSNCYKVILDCDIQVSGVYKSAGFEIKGTQMGLYF